MMLSSMLVFASRRSGDPNNCRRLGAGIEMNGNTSWKSLVVWDPIAVPNKRGVK